MIKGQGNFHIKRFELINFTHFFFLKQVIFIVLFVYACVCVCILQHSLSSYFSQHHQRNVI